MVQRVREVLRLHAALCDFPRNQYASLKNAALANDLDFLLHPFNTERNPMERHETGW
jgi:hypothetical protein